jgi:predicted thioesterase
MLGQERRIVRVPDYRNITPIGPELRVEAHVDRVEGRKRFLTGTTYHDGTLTAAAEGLFVELRPGRP